MTKKTFAFIGAALMAMTLSLGACGKKAKDGDTTPKAEEKAANPCGGAEGNPCGGNPCGGAEGNPCGGNPCGGNPCGGGQ
jgi:hypothetical protein